MDDTTVEQATWTAEAVPERRPCTRCDGQQHLVVSEHGMGKFRCDTCQLVVGFDLDSVPAEFLIGRGLPGRYTRDLFGEQLLPAEQRLIAAQPS